MKIRKVLGVFLTLTGCIAAFLGLAAIILPLVANVQTRLVLDSFATPSGNPAVNAMNAVMSFVLQNSYLTLFCGLAATLAGILLLLSDSRAEEEAWNEANGSSAYRRPSETASGGEPEWNRSRPAGENAPVWRASRAERPEESNPFATYSAEDGLAIGRGWRGSFGEVMSSRGGSGFAPQSASAEPLEEKREELLNAYQRPESAAVQESPAASPQVAPVFEPQEEAAPQTLFPEEEAPLAAPAEESSPLREEPTRTPAFAPAPKLYEEAPMYVPASVAEKKTAEEEPEAAPRRQRFRGEPKTQEYTPNEPETPSKPKVTIKSTMGRHTC